MVIQKILEQDYVAMLAEDGGKIMISKTAARLSKTLHTSICAPGFFFNIQFMHMQFLFCWLFFFLKWEQKKIKRKPNPSKGRGTGHFCEECLLASTQSRGRIS